LTIHPSTAYGAAVPITAVAFDFGGVLTEPPFVGLDAYAAALGLPAGALARYFRGDPEMARLETGEIRSRDFFKYVCIDAEACHGIRIDLHELAAAANPRLSAEMLELVTEVRARHRTALLTNNVREATWRAAFPMHLFDVVVDSSAVGVRKPDPAIYTALITRLACPPGEIAFFDDFEENLAPAAAFGITAIHFTDIATCRAALADLGVLTPALS
jgi:epoxide hydrolase-like predicted phosphatase